MSIRTTTWIATAMLCATLAVRPAARQGDRAEVTLQVAMTKQLVDGKLNEAIELYKQVVASTGVSRPVAAEALLQMGVCYEDLGKPEARAAYERIVANYADQPGVVAQATSRLEALGSAMTNRRILSGSLGQLNLNQAAQWPGARVSSDGHYLAYGAPESRFVIEDLKAVHPDRTVDLKLDSFSACTEVAFSADSRQVASACHRTIVVASADGSNARVLHTDAENRFFHLQWLPDGKQLLALSVNGDTPTAAAVTVDTSNGSARLRPLSLPASGPLSHPVTFIFALQLSPDGRLAAYANPSDPSSDAPGLYVRDLATGTETLIPETDGNASRPAWTADGSGVLYLRDRNGVSELWLAHITDGKPQTPPERMKADVAATGQQIIPVGITREGGYYYSKRTNFVEEYVVAMDRATGMVTGRPSLIDVPTACGPDWSPDGRTIVLGGRVVGHANTPCSFLVVHPLDGTRDKVITTGLDELRRPRWSPDGKSVLVWGRKQNVYGDFTVDVASGSTTLVVENTTNPVTGDFIMAANWSPDGKGIFIGRLEKQHYRVVYRDLATGKEDERYHVDFPGNIYFNDISVSQNGELCLLANDADGVRDVVVIPAGGGAPKTVLTSKQPNTVSWAEISGDGQTVWASQRRGTAADPNARQLMRLPAAGGDPVYTGLTVSGMDNTVPSRDGSRLLFGKFGSVEEMWVLENFLPKATGARVK